MRRLLLAPLLLLTLAAIPVTDAWAVGLNRDVRATYTNATNQPLDFSYYTADGKLKRVPLDPGETVRDLTRDSSTLTAVLDDCGPSRLTLSNPIAGAPGAILRDSQQPGGDNDSFSEGERRVLTYEGVRVAVTRRHDTKDDKEFDVDVLGCRVDPEPTQAPATPNSGGATLSVNATIHNVTGAPVDVGYRTRDDRWRAVTIGPGATSARFGVDRRALMLVLTGCGPARIEFRNPPVFAPSVALWTERWLVPGQELDERESTTFAKDGRKVVVTRGADADDAKQFAVDLVDCEGR
jgi:hypothetical protein